MAPLPPVGRVRGLLADASTRGVGPKYLIQHSGGQRQVQLHRVAGPPANWAGAGRQGALRFGHRRHGPAGYWTSRYGTPSSSSPRSAPSWAKPKSSGHLRTLLQDGSGSVITTVQKFPFILDAIGDDHRGRKFAIIIDEAHSMLKAKPDWEN